MREERLGSYSIVATLPGTPNFSRLKSIRRSFCLCPPPWCRTGMPPELRRPPVRCLDASSGLCGFSVVMSSFTSVVWNRSVGVIGRNVLIGIVLALCFQRLNYRRLLSLLLLNFHYGKTFCNQNSYRLFT